MFKVDRYYDNNYFLVSNQNVIYKISINKSGNVWFLSINNKGVTNNKIIFKLFHIIKETMLEENGLIQLRNIKKLYATVKGNDRNKKTNAFTRWLDSYEITKNPELDVVGTNEKMKIDANLICIDITRNKIENKTENKIDKIEEINFCNNCGFKNKNYNFCPGCGNKLNI
jgi:rubrerythrin